MKIDFSKKIVIVTGGTKGIGAAIVELFQQCNAQVIATGTNSNELERLNRESKGKRTEYIHLDISLDDSVKKFLEHMAKLNRVDALINNAGVNKIDLIYEITENLWKPTPSISGDDKTHFF